MLISRTDDLNNLNNLLKIFPVVAVLGARQCGKTTLSKQIVYDHYFDLENLRDLARLDNPQLALESLEGLIIIDEIQRAPDLFSLLRFLVDKQGNQQKYLILGSASQNLIQQSSESLAGRIGYYHLGGFNIQDVGFDNCKTLWNRGGYPLSFLANTEYDSQVWLENYILTFLQRDIPQLGIQIPSRTMHRFWVMLSHFHGQILNYSELGRSFGISNVSIRKYIDILEGTFMIRVLQPWFSNVKKRLVKRPKIYIRDSGLFHRLMSIENENQLLSHPKLGASWEGFGMEQVCRIIQKNHTQVYFWRTHEGAEIDLFWQRGGKNWGVEFKYMDAPKRTKSMQIAMKDLELSHLWIVYPGNDSYQIDDNITVIPLNKVTNDFNV